MDLHVGRMGLTLLAIACLIAALPAQAQVYKCRDARGVTRYSDKPQPDCPGREVEIRGQEPISGKLDTYGSDLGAAERDFQRRRIERERADEAQAKAAAERQRRCDQLLANYHRFVGARRLGTRDSAGNVVPMGAEERDARAAQMEAQIRSECR